MTKIFISQPMNGKTDEEIKKEREKAPIGAKPLWFLGKSIELLSNANVVYFVKGWKEARGCRIEHQCAVQYGIDRIEE